MKNKFKFWKVLLIVVGGLVMINMAGCPTDGGIVNNEPKNLTIEGIDSSINQWFVALFKDIPPKGQNPQNTAVGGNSKSGNSITIDLRIPTESGSMSNEKWTGSGEYYIMITPIVGGSSDNANARGYVGNGNTPVRVNFDSAIKTLQFGQFKLVSDIQY
jgi:hypothetical protein